MDNKEFEIPESFFSAPNPPEAIPTPVAPSYITTTSEPWPSRLPFDIALGIDSYDDLELRYDLNTQQLDYLLVNPLFQKAVQSHREEMTANGVSFKHKAKIQAETYLSELDTIIADRSITPSVRLQAIQSVVKYAGLEPTPDKTTGNQTTRMVIQWGENQSTQMAIEVKNESSDD